MNQLFEESAQVTSEALKDQDAAIPIKYATSQDDEEASFEH